MAAWVGYSVVDAFASEPFAGNPAAVVVLDGPGDEAWMRAVAREMNLSETAFVHPHAAAWAIRWLTPAVEVDLCGHATLAAAHVLWEAGGPEEITFRSRSGLLTARRGEGGGTLALPARPAHGASAPQGLVEALGIAAPTFVGRSVDDWLVVVDDEDVVRRITPDLPRLRAIEARGIIVSAPAAGSAGGGYDFISRFFAPRAGVDEDPVTGSAHCTLGPHWAERLGRRRLRAFQASPRGGELSVEVAEDGVRLTGRAITVARGEVRGPP